MFGKNSIIYTRALTDSKQIKTTKALHTAKRIIEIILILVIVFFYAYKFLSSYYSQLDNRSLDIVLLVLLYAVPISYGIVSLIFHKTFKKLLSQVINDNTYSELAEYRQMLYDRISYKDKKVLFCVISFCLGLVCIIISAFTESYPAISYVAMGGGVVALAIAFVFFVLQIIKAQNLDSKFVTDSYDYAKVIDKSNNVNANIYVQNSVYENIKYLYPDEQLYKKYEIVQKRYAKLLFVIGVPIILVCLVLIVLLGFDIVWQLNIKGYMSLILWAGIALSILSVNLLTRKQFKDLSDAQNKILTSDTKYQLNLQLCKSFEKRTKFVSWSFIALCAVSFVVALVLAIIFPNTFYSALSFLLLFVYMFIVALAVGNFSKVENQLIMQIEHNLTAESKNDDKSNS